MAVEQIGVGREELEHFGEAAGGEVVVAADARALPEMDGRGEACALKTKCCPNAPARKIARSIYETARDKARAIAKTEAYAVSRRQRKKVEMLFAHLKRILRLDQFACAAAAERKTSSCWPPPPKI